MRIFAGLLGIGLLVAGFALGGPASNLFDFYTFFIVLGSAFAFTYLAHGKVLWRAMRLAFLTVPANAAACRECIPALKSLRTVFLSVGIVCAIIGAISMAKGMDSFEHFGPALAVLLLSPFYGVFFAELLVAPAMHRLEGISRHDD